METKLGRIADKSARENRPIFSLYHLLNEELLLKCHQELSGNKAVGIDSIPEEICKSLRVVTVNVVMKSRMRESRTYGSERISHREV